MKRLQRELNENVLPLQVQKAVCGHHRGKTRGDPHINENKLLPEIIMFSSFHYKNSDYARENSANWEGKGSKQKMLKVLYVLICKFVDNKREDRRFWTECSMPTRAQIQHA
jgi:hypothetical protein